MPASNLRRHPALAHIAPLLTFMLIGFFGHELFLLFGLKFNPDLWLYPMQAIAGIALVIFFWPSYRFTPIRGLPLAAACAALGIGAWIAPAIIYQRFGAPPGLSQPIFGLDLEWRELLGLADRSEGFDPHLYEETWLPLWAGLALRFFRMVITVAFVEEICWRGFVMRLVDNPDRPFHTNPFGRHRWRTYAIVTSLVVVAHMPVDYLGAFIYGSLTYFVAVRTKSLAACVFMHALANLLLGIYVMSSSQWGFW